MDGEEYKRIISLIQDSSPKLTYCEWFDENDSLWDHTRHSHPYIELISLTATLKFTTPG